MAVDPKKVRKVLVVHGVQVGKDKDQRQDKDITELINNRLGQVPLKYKAELYKYENVNDEAQKEVRNLFKLIGKVSKGGVVTDVLDTAIDVIGDVVTSYLDTSTAAVIRKGLKDKILSNYKAGNPTYIVAHSLGSIYAIDVINELIKDDSLFDRNSRKTWPVQGLMTLGSPIGLPMFKNNGRNKVANFGPGLKYFRWLNYWDRTDPVVSGNIFGKNRTGYEIAEKYQTDSPDQGWVIRDKPVDTGKVWLMSHISYWQNPIIGDDLVDMITS